MDKNHQLQSLDSQGAAFIDAVCADLDGAIPHCGDWTNRALAAHLGMVWSIAAANVHAADPESPTKPDDRRTAPSEDAEIREWLEERLAHVLASLGAVDPDAPSWTFAADQDTAGFWQRRMMHETTVHRIDAEVGAGRDITPIDPVDAADGIDEYAHVGLRFSSGRPNRDYPAESLHLHCTDTEGEWTVAGNGEGDVAVRREHAKGDAAVRGAAHDLLCWIWGRPGGPVEVFGDAELAARWQSLAP